MLLPSQIPLNFVAVDAHEVTELIDGDDLVGLFLELGFNAFEEGPGGADGFAGETGDCFWIDYGCFHGANG